MTRFRAKSYKRCVVPNKPVVVIPWLFGPLVDTETRARNLVVLLERCVPQLDTRLQIITFLEVCDG